jgi:fumarylpyruvate hydrolase
MRFTIPSVPVHTLSIASRAERFPVYRVFCVGRNYAAHAREMGKDPTREPPFFFMKPAAAVIDASRPVTLEYPTQTQNFQYEVELVVAIGARCIDATLESALDCVFGYAVGLDMTRRDLQLEARNKGRPWEFGKSFAGSAPIGPIHEIASISHPSSATIRLDVNGATKQLSNISKLIWSVAECIMHLSAYDAIQPGDLIMTGTPEGVGPVVPGDVMVAEIAGVGQITGSIVG